MSQPWRLAESMVPLAPLEGAVAFREPKVPLVSSVPSSRLICDAKKFVFGLFGPNRRLSGVPGGVPVVSEDVGPKSIVSLFLLASPSIALTASRPESFPAGGVQKPLVDAAAAPDSSDPTN